MMVNYTYHRIRATYMGKHFPLLLELRRETWASIAVLKSLCPLSVNLSSLSCGRLDDDEQVTAQPSQGGVSDQVQLQSGK